MITPGAQNVPSTPVNNAIKVLRSNKAEEEIYFTAESQLRFSLIVCNNWSNIEGGPIITAALVL